LVNTPMDFYAEPSEFDQLEIKSLRQSRLITNEVTGLNNYQESKTRKSLSVGLLASWARVALKFIKANPRLFFVAKKIVRTSPVKFQSSLHRLLNDTKSRGSGLVMSYSIDLGFALPTSTSPLVTIVIPVYNNWWATYECLRAIQTGINETPFEIIVVDDCSSDLTRDALRNIRGIHVIRNEVNLGYLLSTNLGASKANSNSKYILALNNDTKPGINWLDELFRESEIDSTIAIAGSTLIYPNGVLQEAGSQIFRDGSGWNLGRGDFFPNPRHSNMREVDYCSAASILVRKEFWDRVRGFDERFVPAYYEDTDLAFSARSMGYKVVIIPTSIVIHYEGLSHGTSIDAGGKKHQELNRLKFSEKWEAVLKDHWKNEGFSRLEQKRESKGIVVICDQQLPAPQRDSGSHRTARLIHHVMNLGYHVVLGSLDPSSTETNMTQLRRSGVEIHYEINSLIDSLQGRFSRVHAFWLIRPNVIEQVKSMLPKDALGSLLIGDFLDLPPHKASELRLDAHTLRLAKSVDRCVLVSSEEADFLASKGISHVSSVWHDFKVQENRRVWESTSGAIFVGGFRHQPNVEGLVWFIQEVLPIIRTQDPEFQMRVIGSGYPSDFINFLTTSNVIYLGSIGDLKPLYATARMSIVPLLTGAGMKGKLAEALSFGVPVVSTSLGTEGFGFTEELAPVFTRDTPADFAEACLELNVNESLNMGMGKTGQKYVERYLSEDSVRRKIGSVLNQ
jgi:GT2 family glycosyltransferase